MDRQPKAKEVREVAKPHRVIIALLVTFLVGCLNFYGPFELSRILMHRYAIAPDWEYAFFWSAYGVSLLIVLYIAYKALK